MEANRNFTLVSSPLLCSADPINLFPEQLTGSCGPQRQTPPVYAAPCGTTREHGGFLQTNTANRLQVTFLLRNTEIKIWLSTTLLFHTLHFIPGGNQSWLCSSEGRACGVLSVWNKAPLTFQRTQKCSPRSSDTPATSTRDGCPQAGQPSFSQQEQSGEQGHHSPPGALCGGFFDAVRWKPHKCFELQWTPAPLHSQTDNSTFRVTSSWRTNEKVRGGKGVPSEAGKNFQQVPGFWPWQY